jgi:membrane AbrB-like protein
MASSAPVGDLLRHFAETLAVATIGGVAFASAGFPAGLIAGSMLAVAIAALAGRPMVVPMAVARVSFVLIGMLLGAVITPELVRGVARYPVSIALLIAAALLMIVLTACYLRFVHRWDAGSALMGASPGSLAQVMAISTELKLDVRAIAIVQTVRVVLLTVGLPLGLALFGLTAAPALPSRLGSAPDPLELSILVVLSTVAALAFVWIRFPGGLLFGAMAASGLLYGTGMVHTTFPWWIGGAGVILLGAVAGARFANTSARMLIGYLGAAFGSFATSIAVASAFVAAVTALVPVRVADVVVAFSPGAQDTMMVLALALHLDPVFVAAHHVVRFVVVSVTVPLLVRAIVKRRPPDQNGWRPPRRGSFED